MFRFGLDHLLLTCFSKSGNLGRKYHRLITVCVNSATFFQPESYTYLNKENGYRGSLLRGPFPLYFSLISERIISYGVEVKLPPKMHCIHPPLSQYRSCLAVMQCCNNSRHATQLSVTKQNYKRSSVTIRKLQIWTNRRWFFRPSCHPTRYLSAHHDSLR